MQRTAWICVVLGTASLLAQSAVPTAGEPTPQSIEEFRAAAERVLQDAGVPGAGIALVRQQAVEWEGGIGYADRDAKTAVTADTHFRVGSISKTFIAMSLVQLSEDGELDLDATVAEVAPEIDIDNPWNDVAPVRVIHLLQHTAGFDDMHLNERYVPDGEAERSMEDILKINPHSRRVRWQPGTRMSYSNPGYGVAGFVLEKVTGERHEDYIKREIFDPLQMTTSSFQLSAPDTALLAKGYAGPTGPPVGYPQIYLRPAGNMHSSPREMARFIRMLLNWGELETAFVIDPEFLGNMEQPRTTLAAAAGLRDGYGSGIFTALNLPYRVLGHNGGINGFLSTYGYSPARDVGYVILLNSAHGGASDAINRLASLAIRYLKRDVDPPSKPAVTLEPSTLDRYVGYYHDTSPRNQLFWPFQSMLAGRSIVRDGDHLYAVPVVGERVRLTAVTENAFRLDNELDASRIFIQHEGGTMVMTGGGGLFAERRPRWQVEAVRLPVLATLPLLASVFPVALVWVARIRRAQPRGFWDLKMALLLCPLIVILPVAALALTPSLEWGTRNVGTIAVFAGTLGLPLLALVVGGLTLNAARRGASRLLTGYAAVVALALGGLSLYLSTHDLLALRLWTY